MYSIFESVINKGGWKLGEMLERIRTYAAEGKLTMGEMDKLEALAREKANMQDGTDMLGMLLDHEARLRALESRIGTTDTPTDDGELNVADVAEYVPGKWYYSGDVVRWHENAYACIAPEGVVCVWSPADYPAYWEKLL
ncbi:MAG: hypothetical protein IKU38_08295 [Clostridia bacterium]|nr:hypothetical protein [Clostridia bacterium]